MCFLWNNTVLELSFVIFSFAASFSPSQNLNSLCGKNIDGLKFPGDKSLTQQNNNHQKKGIQVLPDGEGLSYLNEYNRLCKQRCVHFGVFSSSYPFIQFFFPGQVTNIPSGMVTDQFGMIGLLMFIRAAETDPGMVHLALGSDLTTLGLNLNSPE